MIAAAASRCADARQARGHDLRLLGRARHDRRPRRHDAPRPSPPSSRTRPPSAWSTPRPPPCASFPRPACKVGDTVEFGGLLGSAPVQAGTPLFQRGLHRPRRAYPRAAAQPEKLKLPSRQKNGRCFFRSVRFHFHVSARKVLQMAQALERGVERFILLGKMQTDDVVHVLVEE